MAKIYHVNLSGDERGQLLELIKSGEHPARKINRARILLLADEGKCVLFSSHIMQEVSMLCEHIVVIAGGQVAALGSPDDLRHATGKDTLEDAFVAAIGTEEGLEK